MQSLGAWTISVISHMLLVTSEPLTGTTQTSILVTVDTREGVGRETDTTREIERETDSTTHPAQEIETGTVTVTEKESTRKRAGPASYLIMSTS